MLDDTGELLLAAVISAMHIPENEGTRVVGLDLTWNELAVVAFLLNQDSAESWAYERNSLAGKVAVNLKRFTAGGDLVE